VQPLLRYIPGTTADPFGGPSRLGQAVRCAQALGLDRDMSVSTCLQDEIRHRMWWELVDSDMYVIDSPF
jgi:hypothetical protein